ncbi:MAG: hypothetical protein ABEJ24_05405 [Candidatus Magasanikbacteria bacterium]
MPHFTSTNFPDKEYLKGLVEAEKVSVEDYQNPEELLVMWSGATLNWIGDAFTDPNVDWENREVDINKLRLTGTNPDWNEIIISKANRSPEKLKELIRKDKQIAEEFDTVEYDDIPVLLRKHQESKFSVFDGMHRVIGAIKENKNKIEAWIASREEGSKIEPDCEPHVIYDFIRAYQRGSCKDKDKLIAALKFLRQSYGNVDWLLKNRFGPEWVGNEEIQEIIKEVLEK